MPESEAKRKWMKENTRIINAKLTKNADKDILQYLEGKQPATEIKRALRMMIAMEQAMQENGGQ